MSDAVVDDIVAVLPPLLQSLEALSFIARHLNPPDFGRVMEAAGTPDQALQAVLARLADWPEEFVHLRAPLEAASAAALAAFEGLRAVENGDGDLIDGVSRAAPRPARAGGAVSAGREAAAGLQFLPRSSIARRRRPAGAAGAAGQ